MILRETQNRNDADDAMTLNPGYGIVISSKQRHKRHQRHYRHTRTTRGFGVHPRNVHVDDHMLC